LKKKAKMEVGSDVKAFEMEKCIQKGKKQNCWVCGVPPPSGILNS
jgi:hypothetical protein